MAEILKNLSAVAFWTGGVCLAAALALFLYDCFPVWIRALRSTGILRRKTGTKTGAKSEREKTVSLKTGETSTVLLPETEEKTPVFVFPREENDEKN